MSFFQKSIRSDEDLLTSLRQGSEDAFTVIYERYHKLLYVLAYKYLKSTGDIRSLVLYLILIQFIVFSVARIYTGLSTRALSIVWLLFVFKSIGNKYTLNNK